MAMPRPYRNLWPTVSWSCRYAYTVVSQLPSVTIQVCIATQLPIVRRVAYAPGRIAGCVAARCCRVAARCCRVAGLYRSPGTLYRDPKFAPHPRYNVLYPHSPWPGQACKHAVARPARRPTVSWPCPGSAQASLPSPMSRYNPLYHDSNGQ